jgi:hypothetical protein
MCDYAIYIRTQTGYIKRMKNIVSGFPTFLKVHYGSLLPYIHEEKLVGFPEPAVLWANKSGPSVGIAPITPPELEDISELGVC